MESNICNASAWCIARHSPPVYNNRNTLENLRINKTYKCSQKLTGILLNTLNRKVCFPNEQRRVSRTRTEERKKKVVKQHSRLDFSHLTVQRLIDLFLLVYIYNICPNIGHSFRNFRPGKTMNEWVGKFQLFVRYIYIVCVAGGMGMRIVYINHLCTSNVHLYVYP